MHPYVFFIVIALIGLSLNNLSFNESNQPDVRGRTPLYLAAEKGDVSKVRELLEKIDSPDQRDDCNWTPLMRAAQNGHFKAAELLLAAGADVNAVDKGGYSVLMVVSIFNNAKVLGLLIEYGASVDLQDPGFGWSGLIWSAKEGHYQNVKTLIEAGADKNLRDLSGKSALDWARENQHSEIVNLLTSI
ncbi:MAG: ankyrin repeat domain-containing protein [Gammaproteobacteria bacterium]|nr:ankyrin repeat domain-containing protein [Gammaproteobacteria bacterium]